MTVILSVPTPAKADGWSSDADSTAKQAGGSYSSVSRAFDSTTVRLDLKPGEGSVPVVWTYKNQWDIPLVVEKFEQSCGCLAGEDPQQEVEPGETGRIEAKFVPGPYRGLVRKSVHVRFVGFDDPVELVAEVRIPSSVELSAHELVWKEGDLEAKTIEVSAGTSAAIHLTHLVGLSSEQFEVEADTVEEGRRYRLKVTPKRIASVGSVCLQVHTDSADPRDRVVAVFLTVESADPSSTDKAPPASSGP